MWTGEEILQILESEGIKRGTSVYIYNLGMITQNVNNIKKYFDGWNILYSMKANPNIDILKRIFQLGVGIDAASKNEVLLAKKVGFEKEKIFYSSPGKTYRDLEECHDKCTIIVDSMNEILRLSKIGKLQDKKIKVGVRVNITNDYMTGNAFEVMGGVTSKFGISIEEFKNATEIYSDHPNIEIIGLHVYFGSQILNKDILVNNLILIAEFANLFCKEIKLEFVNFGGGFGIPYKYNDEKLDIQYIGKNEKLKYAIGNLQRNGIRCNLELGRYLVGNAGIYITSVEDIKVSYDKKYVILASGFNGFFRPIFTKEFHIIEKCDSKIDEYESITLVGNLCTPMDQYYEDIVFPKLDIGDWIWFHNAGAYGYTMCLLEFISHDKPLEIIISGDEQWDI